jgi:hypothetical protein
LRYSGQAHHRTRTSRCGNCGKPSRSLSTVGCEFT